MKLKTLHEDIDVMKLIADYLMEAGIPARIRPKGDIEISRREKIDEYTPEPFVVISQWEDGSIVPIAINCGATPQPVTAFDVHNPDSFPALADHAKELLGHIDRVLAGDWS